jgi:hypothetical protein
MVSTPRFPGRLPRKLPIFWVDIAGIAEGKIKKRKNRPTVVQGFRGVVATCLDMGCRIVASTKKQGWLLPLIILVGILWASAKPGQQKSPAPSPVVQPAPAVSYAAPAVAPRTVQTVDPEEFVNADTLNVRDRPDGKVVAKIRRGAKVNIYKRNPNSLWARISADGLSPQWVSAQSLCNEPGCYSTTNQRSASTPPPESKQRPAPVAREYSCACSGHNVCIGPRGGRYCITSVGNKKYGV